MFLTVRDNRLGLEEIRRTAETFVRQGWVAQIVESDVHDLHGETTSLGI